MFCSVCKDQKCRNSYTKYVNDSLSFDVVSGKFTHKVRKIEREGRQEVERRQGRDAKQELDEHRKPLDGNHIAICLVQLLCPFPYDLIQRELNRYPILYVCRADIAKGKSRQFGVS
ncbi:hypothetical protein CTI12_AA473690 [Artemisia annua]|uniref:Uncharacterized protein n=1 Tax=Artemisia annua TaxID=35608 RepID=A0A2U1LMV0_ARTAN|nr:hypothetical protein CTI12_AA473690 [Artemisia annua]